VLRLGLRIALALALVAACIGAWRYTPDIAADQLEARYATPPSRFIEIDGARLHVRDQGPREASALLLVHGLGGNLFVWDEWVAALAPHHRVVTFDLPGHGLTGPWPNGGYSIERSAELVGRLASTLGLERFAIGGHSMGGMVAWWAAAGPLRQRITALILVDASGYPRNGPLPFGLQIARAPLLGEVAAFLRTRDDIARGLLQSFARPRADAAIVQRHVDLALRNGNRQALLQRLRSFVPPEPATIRAVAVPTLIIWGNEDPVLATADAEHFTRDIDGSRLLLYNSAGHYPMMERPAESARDVLKFLAALP